MAVVSGTPQVYQTLGPELRSGDGLNNSIGEGLNNYASGMAAAGTNQATALALTGIINMLTTVASGTGVTLPPAKLGKTVWVYNFGANTLAIYGNGSDTIDTTAGATGVTLTTAHRGAMFQCAELGGWRSALIGAVAT